MADGESWRSRRERGRGRGKGTETPASLNKKLRPVGSNAKPSHQNAMQAKRMDLIASVSRSSGLEKDGDDLKNHKLQEEYRIYIQAKAKEVLEMQVHAPESQDERMHRIDKQENLLILFRKLREGIQSSSRNDDFALEVYETSLYYSVICESPKQTIAVISHLFPSNFVEDAKSSHSTLPLPSIWSALTSLLYFLTAYYPSQSAYHQHLASIPHTLLPRKSEVFIWLLLVTKSMRLRNYAKFSTLVQKAFISKLLDTFQVSSSAPNSQEIGPESELAPQTNDLARKAVYCLTDAMKRKFSETSWDVIRSAYRELSCDQTSRETKSWLKRTLNLASIDAENDDLCLEIWLGDKASAGQVRRKEGIEGRWIICKSR
ncbi:hypothetical protein HYPSUDRAFT_53937 [Hypholoma sublateritium FD-334 SS-4]|uniref:Uncharacterized protein n=1 Tax=Hypholoma sublateritium (strain FD-334 SS-4) TaxID=945553 RepID=A0A0D2L9W3_HYPSF|nr:hypothetical protein HYPSUDRAFT_53937 [Hypholoma sublateritium FD-334 SS-4]